MDNKSPLQTPIGYRSVIILLAINLILLAGLAWPVLRLRRAPVVPPLPTATSAQLFPSPSITPSKKPSIETIPATPAPAQPGPNEQETDLSQGLLLLSLADNGYAHLFAYQPQYLPLTRLTYRPWDDRTPSISPSGNQVAFASRQNGYWDVFLLDLTTGLQTRLTDTAAYDAAPTWSADGSQLAYETSDGKAFSISILSTNQPDLPGIPLPANGASQHSPTWSPEGNKLMFVSSKDGLDSLWLANLDQPGTLLTQLTQPSHARITHPAWSPDGSQLAWGQTQNGKADILEIDVRDFSKAPRRIGSGDWPAWSPDGQLLAARVTYPNQDLIAIYQVSTGNILLPAQPLPGRLFGLDWKTSQLPEPLPEALTLAHQSTPTPLWNTPIPQEVSIPGDRMRLAALQGTAPNAYLNERAAPAFDALRDRLGRELGWDYLSSLENAFLPLTSPLPPGFQEDWLYTGRAFSANTNVLNAGWMAVAREDHGDQTYWRVYLKTRFQDGSQGEPLKDIAWDMSARSSGDPQMYEQGGVLLSDPPAGYWLDFTDLAARYGWQRLPALNNWRTFFPAAHLVEFIYPEEMDWHTAMLQLYPPEILVTAAPVKLEASTPTPAPTWYRTRTPTPTLLPSATNTRRPTWTPLP